MGRTNGSIKQFHDTYENLLQSHTKHNLLYLTFAAHELRQPRIELMITAIDEALQTTREPKEGFSKLLIIFPTTPSVKAIIQKLSALEELYSELCRLLNVSVSEYPLELIKLEAGSIWLKIFGESRVISMITKFLESAVTYLYRNYTVEGKITAIPQNVETINSLLQLSKNLEQSGIDNGVLNDNIKQSSIIIGQQLNALLAGEPQVNINGKTIL